MKTLLYHKGKHTGGAPEDAESRVLISILKNCFIRTRSPLVWLFTEAATGCGVAVVAGPYTLKVGSRSQLYKKGVGVHLVPTALHQTLLDFGPTSLKWDGTRLIAHGN